MYLSWQAPPLTKQIKIEEVDQKADQNKKISKNLCVPVYLIKFYQFQLFQAWKKPWNWKTSYENLAIVRAIV